MNKKKYIDLLLTDNAVKHDKQGLFADVIDCTEIALSQTSDDFQIDSSIGLDDLFKVIEEAGRKSLSHSIGPFQAAELIAKKLGTSYNRASKRIQVEINKVNLEDFI